MTRKRYRRLPPEVVMLVRRLTMIELRAALPTDLVATIFGVTPSLVCQETAKGYPEDLDPALARSTVEGVQETLAAWAEWSRSGGG